MDARQKLSLVSMLLQLLIDGKFVDARSGKVFGTEVSSMLPHNLAAVSGVGCKVLH